MKQFIITYDYTDQIIEDSQKTMVHFYTFHRMDRWIAPIIGIVGIIAAIILQDWFPLVLLAGAVLQFILIPFTTKRAIKTEKERVALLNKAQAPQLSWTIDTDNQQITSLKNGQEADTFDIVDVIGLVDTSTLLIIRLKGRLYIPLPKTAFRQGSASELLTWFKETFPTLKVSRR